MSYRSLGRIFLPIAALVVGGACEDQLDRFGGPDAGSSPSSASGGDGAGGAPVSPPGSGGGVTISASGGAGGANAGGAGGAGGGASCSAGSDNFTMEIDRYNQEKYGCAVGLFDVSGVIMGVVQTSDGASLSVDECPPNEDCGGSETTTVTWIAPGLTAPMIPIGNFVDIEFDVAITQGGCTERLQITDLPMWNGLNNPGGFNQTLWLAGADGTNEPFVDAPFDIIPAALGDCGPEGIDAFALEFNLTTDPSAMIEVHQGELKTWPVDLPDTTALEVRNLRSYETGNPNDTTNWAYWVTPTLIQN